MTEMPEHYGFQKSSRSLNKQGDDCVEWAHKVHDRGVLIRDSKDKKGGVLNFSEAGHLGLIAALVSGSLDQS